VVAGALLLVAALAVAGTAPTGSWLLVLVAATVSVVLGVAAVRITYTEVLDTRREAAHERAEQAGAYRALTETRVAEQAVYVATTHATLLRHQATIKRLEERLGDAAGELAEANRVLEAERVRLTEAAELNTQLTARLDDAEERAAQAVVRVAELEQELDVVLAEWRAGTEPVRKRA
jgi:chromosome segregation ATPase